MHGDYWRVNVVILWWSLVLSVVVIEAYLRFGWNEKEANQKQREGGEEKANGGLQTGKENQCGVDRREAADDGWGVEKAGMADEE